MKQDISEKQHYSGALGFVKVLIVAIIIAFDLYILSFTLLAKPCREINMGPTPIGYTDWWSNEEGGPPFPNITVLCISENFEINVIGYYIYWPLHRYLAERGWFFFAYNPKDDVYRSGAMTTE